MGMNASLFCWRRVCRCDLTSSLALARSLFSLFSERCQVCAKRPRSEIHALTLDTFRHLYLEQTWIGTDVRNLLQCIRQLIEVDTISFRVCYQLANVLENSRLDELVSTLYYDDNGDDSKGGAPGKGDADSDARKTRVFGSWHQLPPGRVLQECAQIEYAKFLSRPPTNVST